MSVDLTIESKGLFSESMMCMVLNHPRCNWGNLSLNFWTCIKGGQRALTMQLEL